MKANKPHHPKQQTQQPQQHSPRGEGEEEEDDNTTALLRVELNTGHGGDGGRYGKLYEVAFNYAFMFKCMKLDGEIPTEAERPSGGRSRAHRHRRR